MSLKILVNVCENTGLKYVYGSVWGTQGEENLNIYEIWVNVLAR